MKVEDVFNEIDLLVEKILNNQNADNKSKSIAFKIQAQARNEKKRLKNDTVKASIKKLTEEELLKLNLIDTVLDKTYSMLLRNNEIYSVGDLLKISKSDLLKVKGSSLMIVNEIEEFVLY